MKKTTALLMLMLCSVAAFAQFSTNTPGTISPGSAFGTNAPGSIGGGGGFSTNTPGIVTNTPGFSTNPPVATPQPISVWAGTNANPNGLYTAGYGSIYNQFDGTGTNFVAQWTKTSSTGNSNWLVVAGGTLPVGVITNNNAAAVTLPNAGNVFTGALNGNATTASKVSGILTNGLNAQNGTLVVMQNGAGMLNGFWSVGFLSGTFQGPLNGTASQATADGNGNNIASTYQTLLGFTPLTPAATTNAANGVYSNNPSGYQTGSQVLTTAQAASASAQSNAITYSQTNVANTNYQVAGNYFSAPSTNVAHVLLATNAPDGNVSASLNQVTNISAAAAFNATNNLPLGLLVTNLAVTTSGGNTNNLKIVNNVLVGNVGNTNVFTLPAGVVTNNAKNVTFSNITDVGTTTLNNATINGITVLNGPAVANEFSANGFLNYPVTLSSYVNINSANAIFQAGDYTDANNNNFFYIDDLASATYFMGRGWEVANNNPSFDNLVVFNNGILVSGGLISGAGSGITGVLVPNLTGPLVTNLTVATSGGLTNSVGVLGRNVVFNLGNTNLGLVTPFAHVPTGVNVGSSPFSFTNKTAQPLECYFNGTIAYSVGKNGVTVFSSMVANDYLLLQPNSYCTVNYTTTAPNFLTNSF